MFIIFVCRCIFIFSCSVRSLLISSICFDTSSSIFAIWPVRSDCLRITVRLSICSLLNLALNNSTESSRVSFLERTLLLSSVSPAFKRPFVTERWHSTSESEINTPASYSYTVSSINHSYSIIIICVGDRVLKLIFISSC